MVQKNESLREISVVAEFFILLCAHYGSERGGAAAMVGLHSKKSKLYPGDL
jgi:hypothetical protein